MTRSQRRRQDFLYVIADHSMLIAASMVFLLPIFFIVSTSLMTRSQSVGHNLIPHPFAWGNYREVFLAVPFLKWTLNTLFISVLTMIGTVISSVPPAYVLARVNWKGRGTVFIFILATMMLPGQVTMIQVYVMFNNFGWIPSMLPLIVPSFFSGAFSIFLLRQFFTTIPEEITEAARIDGCGEWGIMLRIIIPLAKPAIAAVGLFAFLGAWNDFFSPLLYLVEDPNLWTLGIGLNAFRGIHHVDANMMMTASALFMAPAIVLFFMSQKVFIEGITLTGVKG